MTTRPSTLATQAAPGRGAGTSGRLDSVHIAASGGAAMQPLASAELVPGRGVAGDRYAAGTGFYSPRPTDPGAREVTLIEAEALDWLATAHGIPFGPDEHRRNLTTRGVDLDRFIGRRFWVGSALLEGVRTCPPCEHLESLTGKRVMVPLIDRAGLRARVVQGGTIHPGDPIRLDS